MSFHISVYFHLSALDSMADVVLQLMSKVWYCFARILRFSDHGHFEVNSAHHQES